MSPAQFRKLALALPDTVESAHMDHPDFRTAGKIFASLGAPGPEWAMVKLTPDQQSAICAEHPDQFKPCQGAWGKRGSTYILLKPASVGVVRAVLQMAHAEMADKKR